MTILNHRVLLEKPHAGDDSFGEPISGWVSLGKRWADVKTLSGLATILAGAELSIVKASVRFNFATTLAAGMRITYAGTVFDIKAVLPTGDRRYVDCTCEAVQ